MGSANTQATRSTLQSVDTTLSENITATQNYIPVASTTNFSTSVVAEIESTNEVVSFETITKNFYQYSEDFIQSYWQKNNTAANATGAVAPDGTSTAQGIRENTATSSHNVIRSTLTTVVGREYVISVFAKWTGQRYLQIAMGSGSVTTNPHQNFDIENGVLGSSAGAITGSITDVGNGWYRCSAVVTSATAAFVPAYGLVPSTTSGRAPSYTGQGSLAGDMLLLWGAQFEETNSITGYLGTGATAPTFGLTTVTRGVNGTTAQAASSGDSIQQLPFAFQQVLATVTSTLSEDIDATQNYVPVASTSGFVKGVDTTIESTNEVVSFATISENQFKYSEELDNPYWTKFQGSITANAGVAPDGTTTADKFTPDTTASSVHVIDASGFGNVPSGNHILSIHVKADGYNFFHWRTDGVNSFFNLTTGTVVSAGSGVTASIEDAGSGYFRCIVSKNFSGGARVSFSPTETGTSRVFTGNGTSGALLWGAQIEDGTTASVYLPTGATSPTVGLTTVTRGVNGTTAQAASSGASVSQTPSLASLNTPVRLRAISVSPDGTGNARLTLCDSNGDTLCDVDIPNAKSYTLNMPEDGIIFPNGVFVSNTDNITAYTVYTEKYSGAGLTS